MRSWRAWLLGVLAVWIVIVAWWAMSPVSDSVPTGIVKGKPTEQTVECDSPLSGNTKPTEPLPALGAGRAYKRPPCGMPHENDRLIFAIDVVLVLVVVVILVKTWKPSEPSPSLENASTA